MALSRIEMATRCRSCRSSRNANTQMWGCASCSRRVCLKCAREEGTVCNTSDLNDVPSVVTVDAAVPEELEQPGEQTLLQALRALAVVLPVNSPIRIPKRARKRVAEIHRKLFDDLMNAMVVSQRNGSERELELALLLRCAYPALLWREKSERSEPANTREALQWKVIRRRLQLAEAGKWDQLIAELSAFTSSRTSNTSIEHSVCVTPQVLRII